MHLRRDTMDCFENDPSTPRNNIVSPEEAETESDLEPVSVEDEGQDDEEGDDEDDAFLDDGDESGTFSALNRQLDELQSALDKIESRNDNIHKELLEILYSNREVRKTINTVTVGGEETEGRASESDSPSTTKSIVNSSETIDKETQDFLDTLKNVTDNIDKI